MNISLVVSAYAVLLDGNPTRYTVSARAGGQWAVCDGQFVLSSVSVDSDRRALSLHDGQRWVWEYDPLPSERDDRFLARTRFESYSAALSAFQEWVEFAKRRWPSKSFEV